MVDGSALAVSKSAPVADSPQEAVVQAVCRMARAYPSVRDEAEHTDMELRVGDDADQAHTDEFIAPEGGADILLARSKVAEPCFGYCSMPDWR